MSKILLTVTITVVIGLTACNSEKTTMDKTKHAEEDMSMEESSITMVASKVVYYTCPMESHKHVHNNEAVQCEECGMVLVPIVKGTDEDHDFYGCPMAEHSHVRSAKPGTCAECGMALRPLKVKI